MARSSSEQQSATLLAMFDVAKRFAATQALDGVSFNVRAGEVHALVGENGAGKSTLMKILAGVHQQDAGYMTLAGAPYRPSRPADALAAGVAMIHQELNLAPHLSVEANILLGQEKTTAGWIRGKTHRHLARDALARLSTQSIPLGTPVGMLPMALQQLVEIARALLSDARVLVFDEPTSSLTERDTAQLFEVIRQMRAAGLGVIYISHFLEEVAQIADRFTVLRDGRVAGGDDLANTTPEQIIRLMVGRELDQMFPVVPHSAGEPLVEIGALSGRRAPRGVSVQVHRGEIFGIAGLVGAGRSEFLRCVFGLEEVVTGKIEMVGVGPVGRSPRQSINRGVGFVSEDRKNEGLSVEMSIADNMTINCLDAYRRLGWISLRRRRDGVRAWMRRIGCKAAGPDQPVAQLSGGNQQKIAIARLLHQDADLLLMDEPTRGIDVGTKAEIYRLIGELAAQRKAILLVSSYLPELLNVCDRIGVMCRGRLREVRRAEDWSADEIMHCATGLEAAS